LLRRNGAAQIVGKGLALLREAHLHEFEKALVVLNRQLGAFSREAQCNQRRTHFRRRPKGATRKPQYEVRASVKLGHHRKVAVQLAARPGGEALSDFELDHGVDFVNQIRIRKEVMQYGRRDVVRQISVQAEAAFRGNRSKVGLQNIPRNNR